MDALRSSTVGMPKLAEEIKVKFCSSKPDTSKPDTSQPDTGKGMHIALALATCVPCSIASLSVYNYDGKPRHL